MKEIKNLIIKNNYFGELDYDSLAQEMKDKVMPLLIFIVLKRKRDLKSRGVANRSYQRIYIDKNNVSSPILDFYAFKYVYAIIAKEEKDMVTVDLPRYFLQTEMDGEEKIILKLTRAIVLLLVELDPRRWKNHLK